MSLKIGDRVYVHGHIDEIRKDTVIIRNEGGYFGTVPSEIVNGEFTHLYEIQDTIESLPPAQPERAVKDCRNCGYGGYNDHYCTYFCYCADECKDWDKWKPSLQPEERLKRISDLVEGSIDHFDRDDAMDLLYQIKAVLK